MTLLQVLELKTCVELAKLKSGTWRYLNASEMEQINEMIENSSNTQEASKDPNKKRYVPKHRSKHQQKKDYGKSKKSERGKDERNKKGKGPKPKGKSPRQRKRRT